MASDLPVGVFDSGVGGLSVLHCLRETLPGEKWIYYGDTKYAPYGTKTPEEVLLRVETVVQELEKSAIKALVIACNTATAAAAATLRAEKGYPIIGMEPALKPAALARHGGRVLVLATPMTLRLPKFARLMGQWGEGAVPLPCPGLMELVEAERFDDAVDYVLRLVEAHSDQPVDALVLGCTHYVFLRTLLEKRLPAGIALMDGNLGTAHQLARVLADHQLLADPGAPSLRLMTSSDEPETIERMQRLLDWADRECRM